MIKATVVTEIKVSFQGTDLTDERSRLGLTQEQLAERIGVKQPNYVRYERPGLRTISGDTYHKLIAAGIKFIV